MIKITGRELRKLIREAVESENIAETEEADMCEVDEELDESQRGNDENSQHDNDTDPGDPYAKRAKK